MSKINNEAEGIAFVAVIIGIGIACVAQHYTSDPFLMLGLGLLSAAGSFVTICTLSK